MNEPEIAYAKASPFQRCDDKFPKGRSILVQSFRFIPLSPGKNASPLQSPYLIAHCDRADNDPDDKELNAWQRIEGLLEVIEPVSAWVSPHSHSSSRLLQLLARNQTHVHSS